MTKKTWFYILLLLLLGIMGCQRKDMKISDQILRINYFSPPSSLQPHLVSDIRTHTICKALFEGLTRMNLEGQVELAAAEKVEISSCKTKYTFTLRPSKWSNGNPLTSNHFKTGWEKALNPRSKCIRVKQLFLIKNGEKVYNGSLSFEELGLYTPSDNQLVVELEHPAPYFLQLLADPLFSPVYESDLEKDPTVFNGPFLLEDYKLNRHITLSTNSNYWDKKTVKLKKIEISLVKDEQTAFSMYEKGQLNWHGSPFTNISEEIIRTIPNIKSQQASAPFWIFCNEQNPKLRSANMRKALSYALDREDIIKHVLSQKQALYTILPKELSSVKKDTLLTYDLKKAQDLFDKALKEDHLSKTDFQLTLNHSNIPEQEKLAAYLKYQWEKAFGIHITLKKEDWNTFYANIKSGNYEIGGFYLFNLYDDPFYLMESFESTHNHSLSWDHALYQKYLDLARSSSDEMARKEFLEKAETILMQEMPVIPIYNHTHLYVCNQSLKRFSSPKFNYADFKWAYFEE